MPENTQSRAAPARHGTYLYSGTSLAAWHEANRAQQMGDLWALTRALLILFGGVALIALAFS